MKVAKPRPRRMEKIPTRWPRKWRKNPQLSKPRRPKKAQRKRPALALKNLPSPPSKNPRRTNQSRRLRHQMKSPARKIRNQAALKKSGQNQSKKRLRLNKHDRYESSPNQ